jgi:hypothetical protein
MFSGTINIDYEYGQTFKLLPISDVHYDGKGRNSLCDMAKLRKNLKETVDENTIILGIGDWFGGIIPSDVKRYRKEHDLMGVDENSIFKFNPDFSPSDIVSLVYPSDDSLQRHGIRGIYLSNFLRWDPVAQHGFVREKYGYHGRKASRSYYEYDNPDCPVYLGFQDLLKEKRLGYGKVTDQLVRDIRHKRIDKSTALAIERDYLGQTPQGITKFADWLGVPLRNLDTVLLANANDFANQILTENWRGEIVDSDAPIELLEGDQKCLLDQDFINIGKGL